MKEKDTKRDVRRYAAFTFPLIVKRNSLGGGREGDLTKGRTARTIVVNILTFGKYLLFRWLFCFIFAILPAIIMQAARPGLEDRQEVLIVYMWFFMITIRESYVFTRVLDFGKYDRILMRSFNISHGDAFLGRLKIRSVTEFIYHFFLLIIFRVSVYHAICLCILTLFFRWAGERKELKRYQKYEEIDFDRRRRQMNILRIVCACAAYIFPLAVGIMADGWFWLIHPLVLALLTPKALLNLRYLFKYKNYDYITGEIISGEAKEKGFCVK